MESPSVPVLRAHSISTRRKNHNTRNLVFIPQRGSKLQRASKYAPVFKPNNAGTQAQVTALAAPIETALNVWSKPSVRQLLANCYEAVELALSVQRAALTVSEYEWDTSERKVSRPIGCERHPPMLGTAYKISYTGKILPSAKFQFNSGKTSSL